MKTNMNNIKTIFLDWNGTICNNVFWEQLNSENTKELFDKITKSLFVNNGRLINPWMKNEINMNDIINIVCDETKINKRFLKEQLIYSSINMNFINLEIPNIIKLIQEKGIKVVLASDNMDIFRYTITNLKIDLLFDDLLLSNEIGFVKSELKNNKSLFFDNYINKHHLTYNNCVLIDDSQEIANTCKSIGMNNIKINDCKKTIEELRRFA